MVKKSANGKKKSFGFFGNISLFFVEKPKFTALLMIGVVGFGILSYTNLIRREGFPSINLPIAVVQGAYFADDVSVVDEEISKPLQESVSKLDDVESVTTNSAANFMFLTASLQNGASNLSIESELAEAISSTDLPENSQVQIFNLDATKFLSEYDMIISVYSVNGGIAEELEGKANELAPLFSDIEVVQISQVESLFESGVNPFTQEEVTEQVSFNQIGRYGPENSDMEFFNTAVIGITGLSGDELDIFELSDAVNTRIDEINASSEDGTMLTVSADFTKTVSGQIDSLQNNVMTGIIAILIISTIIIGWRVSATMAIFVLSVLSVTIGVLYLLGLTLNVITLFALVLALGLFVDDATIISEAIDARKRKYKGYRSVIGNAVSSVGSASFAGTTTTILVFFPLLFITGILGEFIVAMPVTIIVALITSLTLSLTLIPFLSRYTILTKNSVAKPKSASLWQMPSKAISGTAKFLANGIRSLKSGNRLFGLVSGTAMFLLSIVAFMGAGYFFSQLGFNIFPPSKDSDEISVNIQYEDGTSIEKAQLIAAETNVVIADSVGSELYEVNYGGQGLANTSGATARLELTNFRTRDVASPQMIETLEGDLKSANIKGASFTVAQNDPGGPQSTLPFAVQIYSEDSTVAYKAADDIEAYLKDLQLTLNNGDTVKVIITDQSNREEVTRNDGRRFVTVNAGYDSDQVSELLQLTRDAVQAEYTSERLLALGLTGEQEQDLGFDFGNESENEESFESLGPMALISLAAMFVLLMVQFRSLTKPILIFLAIPFSLFGVAFGLFITGNPLSFFAMIGFIGLIGIVVNNTILLVDAATRNRREGKDAIDSIALGLEERFRPLITTTLTTVVALTPLAISDPFWEPLAVTIIFGLLSSTILVIFSFPSYYIVFDVITSLFGRMFKKVFSR